MKTLIEILIRKLYILTFTSLLRAFLKYARPKKQENLNKYLKALKFSLVELLRYKKASKKLLNSNTQKISRLFSKTKKPGKGKKKRKKSQIN